MTQDKSKSLTPSVLDIVQNRGTEEPGSGAYCLVKQPGTYLCRRCGLALFNSTTKFESGTGWPSFDEALGKNVKEKADRDGRRTEILCARCEAHLGHVFVGEEFTTKNARYCVNSLSIDLVDSESATDSEEAIFAGGCFWGIDHYFRKLTGILKVEVGYSGGTLPNPSYEMVCANRAGHYEVARVLYDPSKTSFEEVCSYFFEIHDPTQRDGQGPDIGQQYESVVFYYDDKQRQVASRLIETLKQTGFDVATKLLPVSIFWPAEDYHQAYYAKKRAESYCHVYTKRF